MLVDGAKQLIEVDISGGTVMLITELAVVSDKAYGLAYFVLFNLW